MINHQCYQHIDIRVYVTVRGVGLPVKFRGLAKNITQIGIS